MSRELLQRLGRLSHSRLLSSDTNLATAVRDFHAQRFSDFSEVLVVCAEQLED